MTNRVVGLVLVFLLVLGLFWLYKEHQDSATNASGTVTVHNSGEKLSTPDQDGAAAQSSSSSQASTLPAQQPTSSYDTNQPAQTSQNGIATSTATSLPSRDTVAPNPPNGLAFGGSGRYQWYRQGQLTWRVDTTTGAACVAFASKPEWNDPLVYSHGCGNS